MPLFLKDKLIKPVKKGTNVSRMAIGIRILLKEGIRRI